MQRAASRNVDAAGRVLLRNDDRIGYVRDPAAICKNARTASGIRGDGAAGQVQRPIRNEIGSPYAAKLALSPPVLSTEVLSAVIPRNVTAAPFDTQAMHSSVPTDICVTDVSEASSV